MADVSLPLAYTFTAPDGIKEVGVQFRDAVGNISEPVTQTIHLDRTVDTNPTLEIDADTLYTNVPTVTLRIGAMPGIASMQISNNGSFNGATWEPFDTTAQWTITTFGEYTIPRTVYVRTRDTNGMVAATASDDIIYDPLPPTGTVSITSVGASSVRVAVAADDSVSGVARMRLSTDATFAGASWRSYAATAAVPRSSTGDLRVYAQFEDRAGNRSTVGCTAHDGSPCVAPGNVRVYLPLVRR